MCLSHLCWLVCRASHAPLPSPLLLTGPKTSSPSSPRCIFVIYDLLLILLSTKDRLIFLLDAHWQLMISFGHVVLFSISSCLLFSFRCPPSTHSSPALCSVCHLKAVWQRRTLKVQKCIIRAALYRQGTVMPLVKDLLRFGSFVWTNAAWMKVTKRHLCQCLFHPSR